MGWRIGDDQPSALMIGDEAASALYRGDELVWSPAVLYMAVEPGSIGGINPAPQLYTLDDVTASATLVGSLGIGSLTRSIGIAAIDDTLYMTADPGGNQRLYTVALLTGATTLVADITGEDHFGSGTGMALYEGQLFFVAGPSATRSLYTLAPSTAVATRVARITSTVPLPGTVSGMTTHQGTLYLASSSRLYTLNPTTAVATSIGLYGTGIFSGTGIGLASHNNQLWLVVGTPSNASLYTVNTNTGAAAVVGMTGVPVETAGALGLASVQ